MVQFAMSVKHKLILRRITDDRLAHRAQMLEYSRHLSRQYADRSCYWQARSLSKLTSGGADFLSVCCILDGMDKAKFKWPRSLAVSSKELQSLMRPNLDAHGVIVLSMILSDVFVRKDSSWCSDLLMHHLNIVGQSADLRRVRLHCQSDNTSREVKNSTLLRLLAFLIGSGRIHSGSLNCLEQGHSHEDIDQFFSGVAALIEGHNELHSPNSFRDCVQSYLDKPHVRSDEPLRFCRIVNNIRDWHSGYQCTCLP